MVLLDHIDDAGVELIFHGQIDAIFDVSDDYQRTHRRGERIVRIFSAIMLVFDEITRLLEFADVVEIRTNAAHWSIGTDFFGSGLCQRGDHQAVVEGTGRFELHLAQKFVIQIAEFQPTDVRGEVKDSLKQWQKTADQQGGDDGSAKSGNAANAENLQVIDRVGAENRNDI